MTLLLETVAKKVEFQAFNGQFNDGSNSGQNRQTRGLINIVLIGDNIVFHDTAGDGTGTAQKLNFDVIAAAMKKGCRCTNERPCAFRQPTALLDSTKKLNATVVSQNYHILPRDRNGGVDIDTIATPLVQSTSFV